jgi:hypothetical protein
MQWVADELDSAFHVAPPGSGFKHSCGPFPKRP